MFTHVPSIFSRFQKISLLSPLLSHHIQPAEYVLQPLLGKMEFDSASGSAGRPFSCFNEGLWDDMFSFGIKTFYYTQKQCFLGGFLTDSNTLACVWLTFNFTVKRFPPFGNTDKHGTNQKHVKFKRLAVLFQELRGFSNTFRDGEPDNLQYGNIFQGFIVAFGLIFVHPIESVQFRTASCRTVEPWRKSVQTFGIPRAMFWWSHRQLITARCWDHSTLWKQFLTCFGIEMIRVYLTIEQMDM